MNLDYGTAFKDYTDNLGADLTNEAVLNYCARKFMALQLSLMAEYFKLVYHQNFQIECGFDMVNYAQIYGIKEG